MDRSYWAEEMVCVHGQQGPWFARSFTAAVIFFFFLLRSASFAAKFWDGVCKEDHVEAFRDEWENPCLR